VKREEEGVCIKLMWLHFRLVLVSALLAIVKKMPKRLKFGMEKSTQYQHKSTNGMFTKFFRFQIMKYGW